MRCCRVEWRAVLPEPYLLHKRFSIVLHHLSQTKRMASQVPLPAGVAVVLLFLPSPPLSPLFAGADRLLMRFAFSSISISSFSFSIKRISVSHLLDSS